MIARRYRFAQHRILKAGIIYAVTLATGITIVIVDEAFHS